MRTLKKLLRNSGMSMTELMVGAGLLGGISLVMMRVTQQNSANEAYMRFSASVNKAALQVQNNINNKSRCSEMLVGEVRDTTPYPGNSPTGRVCGGQGGACSYSLRTTKGTGYEVLLAADTEYAEGFYIPPYGIQLAQSSMGAAVSELIITFKMRNRVLSKNAANIKDTAAANQGTIVKRIPFVSELAGATLKSCGPVVSDSDLAAKEVLCRSLGAAGTWTGSNCILREVKCPAGQVPSQMTSLGTFICISVLNNEMRDALFDYSDSTCPPGQNAISLAAGAGGKIRVVCTGTQATCPSQVLNWKVGEALCSATAPGGIPHGTPAYVVSDGTAPVTGSATFTCGGGGWYINTGVSPTCVDAGRSCPAGQVIEWSAATKFCTATSAYGTHGALTTITDSTNSGGSDGTGSAPVECVNTKWTLTSGAKTCN